LVALVDGKVLIRVPDQNLQIMGVTIVVSSQAMTAIPLPIER
jgi:hypothetical protein